MSLFPVVLVGCGNMGAALIRGVRKAYPAGEIRLVDPDASKVEELVAAGVGVASSLPQALEGARLLILAIKPQMLGVVSKTLSGKLDPGTLVVSILAGVPRSRLIAELGTARVARTMPNLPLMVGKGATALATDGLDAGDLEACRALLRSAGILAEVAESQMDAVTGLSGSGPAFVLRFLQAMEDGGVLAGLPRPVSRDLSMATMAGTIALLQDSGLETDVLRGQVTSPGGTTIHGLKALEDRAFYAAVMEAVMAATKRSKELGNA